jgi:hypothetical protein
MQECDSCGLSGSCLYYECYERPYAKRGYAPPPRPIVLIPPFFGRKIALKGGGRISVELLLLGRTTKNLPHVILALQQFGSQGLGEGRYLGKNRFEVERATCRFSRRVVFNNGVIHPNHLRTTDISRIPPLRGNRFRVKFRTPIELPGGFPPTPEHLLRLIRQRLVMLVNEYGSGDKIPVPRCRGSVRPLSGRIHRLVGYSRRSGRREFWNCWTGIADYSFEEIDETGRWLLGVGRVLGAGAKSSFGLGFFDVSPTGSKPRK